MEDKLLRKTAVLIFLLSFLGLTYCLFVKKIPQAYASDPYWIGWYTSYELPLAEHKTNGVNLVLPIGDYTHTLTLGGYLDEAEKQNIKVIVPVTGRSIPDIMVRINSFKNHPALFGWYLADEPELKPNNPLYTPQKLTEAYTAIKQVDPIHPVLITFGSESGYPNVNAQSQRPYYPALDIIMVDYYPFFTTTPVFRDFELKRIRTVANTFVSEAKIYGKKGFIFVPQGFGGEGSTDMHTLWRNPTLAELRYSLYSSVIRDTLGTVFYYDWVANISGIRSTVNDLITEFKPMREAIRNGKFNDPAVLYIGQDPGYLSYRYFSDTYYRYLIVTEDVPWPVYKSLTFTLPADPADANISQVEVVGEKVGGINRTIPFANHKFTDMFTQYQVHVYKFAKITSPSPTLTPIPPSPTGGPPSIPGDVNGDSHVNAADLSIFISKYGTIDTTCDFNHNGTVDTADYEVLRLNYGR